MPSLFEDHLRRKRFAQNFSHTLPGVSFGLFNFQNSKIQQLFQRLAISSAKRFFKEPQTERLNTGETLSFINPLLDSAFDERKLFQDKNDSYENLLPLSGNIASKVLYPSISAQVLSSYIKRQMSAPQKLKDLDFRINLKTGISMLALYLLKRFPLGSSIRGLRIVCSGR
jgi:isopenicillin N synthase-like dioxygenase